MAQQLLTINIGPVVTLVAEIEKNKNKVKALKCFTVDTPEGLILDGVITPDEGVLNVFAQNFKAILDNNRIKTKKAIFVINSKRIGNREETLPNLPAAKLDALIKTNASSYFPVDMLEYQLCYKPVSEPVKGAENITVNMYAIANDLVHSYERLARKLDLQIEALDYKGNTMAAMTKDIASGKTIATLNIDADETVFTAVKEGKLLMQRSVNYGIGESLRVINNINGFDDATLLGAVKAVMSKNYFLEELTEDEQDALGGSLDMLAGSIKRMLEFYSSKYYEDELENIYLVGIGDDFLGLADFIASVTERPIVNLSSADTVVGNLTQVERRYSCVTSAAIEPLGITFDDGKGNKKGGAGDKKGGSSSGSSLLNDDGNYMPAIVIFILLFGVALGLVGVGAIGYLKAQAEQARLYASIASMQPAKEVYITYLGVKVRASEIVHMDSLSDTNNNKLSDFLLELERKLPTDAAITEMNADEESVAITFVTLDKNVAGNTLVQLRGFNTVLNAETTQISESTAEDSLGEVTFTINCIYNADYTPSDAGKTNSINRQNAAASSQNPSSSTVEEKKPETSVGADKTADDKKKAEEEAAKKAEEDKKKAEEAAKKAEEDKKKAEEAAKKAEEDKKKAEETSTVTSTAANGTYITTGNVTVRKGSSNTTVALGYLDTNTTVNVKGANNDYYLIDYNGGEGWIYAPYCQKKGN